MHLELQPYTWRREISLEENPRILILSFPTQTQMINFSHRAASLEVYQGKVTKSSRSEFRTI